MQQSHQKCGCCGHKREKKCWTQSFHFLDWNQNYFLVCSQNVLSPIKSQFLLLPCLIGSFLLANHLYLLAKNILSRHFANTFCCPNLGIFLLPRPILQLFFVATTNFANIFCCHAQLGGVGCARPELRGCRLTYTTFSLQLFVGLTASCKLGYEIV